MKIEKVDLYQRANMRIGKISSNTEYRIEEQFQNLIIFLVKFWFSKLRKFKNVQLKKLQKYPIWKNTKIYSLKNFKNL